MGVRAAKSAAVSPGGPEVVSCPYFGPGARFHHVGLAVPSIAAANPAAVAVANPTEEVSMAFVDLHGALVELLEPLGDHSPIAGSLRRGTKLLHLCFEVPQLEAALEAGRPAGFHRVSVPVRVPELGARRLVWVYHGHYGLVELIETNGQPEVER